MVTNSADASGKPAGDRPPYNFHALRHAAASLFIEQGWTPKKSTNDYGTLVNPGDIRYLGHLFTSPADDAEAMAQIEARLLS
jgi:hypothetical protein